MSNNNHEEDEFEGLSRTERILKLLALDGSFDLKQGLVLGMPTLLLILLVIMLAPWVVQQQRGVQVTEASLTYPELLVSFEHLAPSLSTPLYNDSESILLKGSPTTNAVRSGRVLTRVPLFLSNNDRESIKAIFEQLDIENINASDIPEEFAQALQNTQVLDSSEVALNVTQSFFKDDALRAYFELGVWLQKAVQSAEVASLTDSAKALQVSYKDRKRILTEVLKLALDEHIILKLNKLMEYKLELNNPISVKAWQQSLNDLAASF